MPPPTGGRTPPNRTSGTPRVTPADIRPRGIPANPVGNQPLARLRRFQIAANLAPKLNCRTHLISTAALLFTALLNQFRHQPRPSSLVAGPNSRSIVPMKLSLK